MADDSVLEPYPNLKVPQWHFQIETLPRLKDEASTSFWQAVEKDGESLLHRCKLMSQKWHLIYPTLSRQTRSCCPA